jgi:hypothetical protein
MSGWVYIKLFHEILHDPKMGQLSDHLWRRCIELFLLAGMQEPRDGRLPKPCDIAWALRTTPQDVDVTLDELEHQGIIINNGNGWVVKNFEKRQSPQDPTGAERQARHRARKTDRDITRDITHVSRVESESESDKEVDKREEEGDEFTRMCQLANELTGLLTTVGDIPTIREWVKNDIQEGDIRAALQWRIDNQRPPAKTISQLAGGVETNRAMRLQVKSARPASNGKKPMITGAIARAREALGNG